MPKNSNRQKGDRPKVARKFRIDADLNDRFVLHAAAIGRSQVDLLELALALMLPQPQAKSELPQTGDRSAASE